MTEVQDHLGSYKARCENLGTVPLMMGRCQLLLRPKQDLTRSIHGFGWVRCLPIQDAVRSFDLRLLRILHSVTSALPRCKVTVLSGHKNYSADVAEDIVSAIVETTV